MTHAELINSIQVMNYGQRAYLLCHSRKRHFLKLKKPSGRVATFHFTGDSKIGPVFTRRFFQFYRQHVAFDGHIIKTSDFRWDMKVSSLHSRFLTTIDRLFKLLERHQTVTELKVYVGYRLSKNVSDLDCWNT